MRTEQEELLRLRIHHLIERSGQGPRRSMRKRYYIIFLAWTAVLVYAQPAQWIS